MPRPMAGGEDDGQGPRPRHVAAHVGAAEACRGGLQAAPPTGQPVSPPPRRSYGSSVGDDGRGRRAGRYATWALGRTSPARPSQLRYGRGQGPRRNRRPRGSPRQATRARLTACSTRSLSPRRRDGLNNPVAVDRAYAGSILPESGWHRQTAIRALSNIRTVTDDRLIAEHMKTLGGSLEQWRMRSVMTVIPARYSFTG